MIKLFKWALILVLLYMATLFARSELSERKAEKKMESIFISISSPWDAKQIRKVCSEWLCNRAKLSPEEIALGANNDFGPLQNFIEKPKCTYSDGYETGDPAKERKVFAECKLKAAFAKGVATFRIRLIEEPRQPARLFGLLGDTLKLNDFIEIHVDKKER